MPQVQFLHNEGLGAAAGKFGSGILDQYTENLQKTREEDALKDMLENLDPEAPEGDVLKQIMQQKGLSIEKKKTVSDIFAQSKGRAQKLEVEKLKAERESAKFDIQNKQKERELDIKEKVANSKSAPKSEYEKIREKEQAKVSVELENELPKIESAMRTSERVGQLIEETTGFGSLNRRKQAELSVGSAALLEPMIKIYNPTGQLPKSKLEWITNRFGINKYDDRYVQRGKLAGINSLLQEQHKRITERQALIEEWKGNVPSNVLNKFDSDSEILYDAISGYDKEFTKNLKEAPKEVTDILGDASKAPQDKIITSPDGKKYKVVKGVWIQL